MSDSDREPLKSTKPGKPSSPLTPASPASAPHREYERSGLYPAEGKPFRMWALFGWLTALIVVLAAVAALLNFTLLDV